MTTKSAILYTDNRLVGPIFNASLNSMTVAAVAEGDMPIQVWCSGGIGSLTLTPRIWTPHIHQGERGLRDCYEKIYKGLENTDAEVVYLLEHDVLYPVGYFSFTPPAAAFYYNRNIWRMNHAGYFDRGIQVTSNCCAARDLLLRCYEMRLGWLDDGKRIVWDEPGRMDEVAPMQHWQSEYPTLDIRHSSNLTGYRTSPAYLMDLPYWGNHTELSKTLNLTDPEA